jgi:hypothetical protein
MMSTMLKTLVARAGRDGWATAEGSLGQIQAEAMTLGWDEIPIRRGDPAVTTLRPLNHSDARPNSLSAKFGTGDQPFHTDGAHMLEPPDVVVLACTSTTETPTRLAKIDRFPSYLEHGIFLVSNGKDSFLSAAYAGGRFRYDPGCMSPCDMRARSAAEFFRNLREKVAEHSWSQPGTLLVINNWRVLHARASAADDPQRELQRVSFRSRRTP